MICADTSIFVDFFRGAGGKSSDALQKALEDKQVVMNPFVLSELLSSPKLPKKLEKYLLDLPRLEIESEFFERAGYLRRKVYEAGHGVSMADIFIAQCCIDAKIALLTADRDFQLLSKYSDLDGVVV